MIEYLRYYAYCTTRCNKCFDIILTEAAYSIGLEAEAS